jgi:hypothetical protein
MISIKGATHYYLGQPEQLAKCIHSVRDWASRKRLLS